MKNIVVTTLAALIAAGLSVVACNPTDEETPTDTSTTDGGEVADSSVELTDSGTPADGSTTTDDASPDTGVAPTEIEITVLSDNTPVSGATVVFNDATGAITSTMLTDAMGKITKAITGGETVTVANGAIVADGGVGPSPDLVTIMAVKPGDKLVVPFYPGTTIPTVNVTLPTNPSAIEYEAQIGRSAEGSGTTINLQLEGSGSLPLPGAPFSVLAYAYGDETFNVAFKKGQMLTGASTAVSFVGGTQPASASWSAGFGSVISNFTGVDSLGEVYISDALTMVSDAMAFQTQLTDDNNTPTARSNTYRTVSNFADSLQSMWFVADSGVRRVIKRAPGGTAMITTAASELLPIVTPGAHDTTNATRPTYKWVLGSAATVDGTRITVITPDMRADRWVEWHLLVPPGATEVKLPEVPNGALGSMLYLADITLVEGDFIANYDEFRALGSVMATREIDQFIGGNRTTGALRTTAISVAK